MTTKSKVTSKGQVTIPQDIRMQMGLRPGDEVEFVVDAKGFRIRKRMLKSPFKKYRGYLGKLRGKDPDSLVETMRGR